MPEYPKIENYEPNITPDYPTGKDNDVFLVEKKDLYQSIGEPRLQEQLKKMKRVIETKLLSDFLDWLDSNGLIDIDGNENEEVINPFLDQRSKPE